MQLLVTLKGLPLAYNKDMQEDKEGALDAAHTLSQCLTVMRGMVSTWTVNADRMRAVMHKGHLAATDVADYLAKRGMPFREAHAVVGHLVLTAEKRGVDIADLPFEEFKAASDLFEPDITGALDLDAVAAARTTQGGTAPVRVPRSPRSRRWSRWGWERRRDVRCSRRRRAHERLRAARGYRLRLGQPMWAVSACSPRTARS